MLTCWLAATTFANEHGTVIGQECKRFRLELRRRAGRQHSRGARPIDRIDPVSAATLIRMRRRSGRPGPLRPANVGRETNQVDVLGCRMLTAKE
jgi:hypothetical protein